MTLVMIGLLAVLAGYLGARLHAAGVENSSLRANVKFLKRRLDQS